MLVNPYAEKLKEHSSLAWESEECFQKQGRWREHFEERMGVRPDRLVLELGSSNAQFLCNLAIKNPKTAFVGIDYKYRASYNAARRADRANIKNISLVRGSFEELGQIFAPAEINELWIFFPDPWAKASQLKHRIIQEAPLLQLSSLLQTESQIHIKTDHPGYFQCMLALFGMEIPRSVSGIGSIDLRERSQRARQFIVRRSEDARLPDRSEALLGQIKVLEFSEDFWREKKAAGSLFEGVPTLFESLFIKDGLPIYYLSLQKTKKPS